MSNFADDFWSIPLTLKSNGALQNQVQNLIGRGALWGKSIEGPGRASNFRKILLSFSNGSMDIDDAAFQTEEDLPRHESPHSLNNRAFADGWGERLVRTHVSRFYNQAVMELVIESDGTKVFVPHSETEDHDSNCSIHLAGKVHSVKELHDKLIAHYELNDWSDRSPCIPNHPHCTHVVKPIE